MSNQELPDWDWVRKLEVDYLPDEVQKLVRHVGVLIYLYARSVDEGKDLWDEIRISSLEHRVKGLEIQLDELKRTNSSTVAELLTSLVLSAALSTGLGLLVSAIAAGTAGLARSALTWHKAAKKAIPPNEVYANMRTSVELVKKFETELAQSKRILESKSFYQELDTKLKIGEQTKGISVKVLSAFVKGEVTSFKDSNLKPSKDILGERPASQLINDHWNGLYATVRSAKHDLDDLLDKYKYLHEMGMLDESLEDESLQDLQKPLRPQLFQSIIPLLQNVMPELKAPLKLISEGIPVTGEISNRLREHFRDFARERFAHIFVFQLSSFLFVPELVESGVKYIDYHQLDSLGPDTTKKDYGIQISNNEYQSPYRINKSRPVLAKVEWKSNQFESYMASLLSLLNAPGEFKRTYLSHAREAVTVGKKRTVRRLVPVLDKGYKYEKVLLKPPNKEEADLEYAYILYTRSLLQNMKSSWPEKLKSLYTYYSTMLRQVIPFQGR